MAGRESSLFERLCEAENPRNLNDWEGRHGYYVAACRASAEDIPGLIEMVRKWSDPEWLDDWNAPQADADDAELLPVTAWRTLADLKADAAVPPLVDLLTEMGDEFDDWISEELPHVFGKIGVSAIEPLVRVARDKRAKQWVRSVAARGLGCVAKYHAQTRNRIVACLGEMMANAVGDEFEFNSTLLVELVELGADEAAETIERAFAADLIDVGMMGNWETVRRTLGVQGLGLTMPNHPQNSINQFRKRMGIGIFSDQPIFKPDEIDPDAEREYYKRACEVFSKSGEGQLVVERHGDLGWSQMLLEFGLHDQGRTVDEMTLGSVEEFVIGYVPRKVMVEADEAAAIVFELTKFWEYLDRVYTLPIAKSIVDWLNTDGLAARLRSRLADPANYSMAKSFAMLGKKAGYDMSSQAGLDAFTAAYNRSLQAVEAPTATSPGVRKDRIGRNDPCHCGSGKKFKKCCGRRT